MQVPYNELYVNCYTVEPLNNGHVGDECFVHNSEVVPSSEVLTCIQLLAGGTQFVHCREVVRSSECPLLEVPLYTYMQVEATPTTSWP